MSLEWLRKLFNSPELSDLTIKTSSREFKVHKAIVCTQCEKFFQACTRGFRETLEGVIDLSEDDDLADDVAIESMLRYFYEQDYTVDDGPETERHPLVHHASVFVQAVYHDIPRLRRLAESKFEAACANEALWDKEAFFDSVRLVYGNTLADAGRALREVMVEVSVACFEEIFEADIDSARRLMDDVPEFTADVAYLLGAENVTLRDDYQHLKSRADDQQRRLREVELRYEELTEAQEDQKTFRCDEGHLWTVYTGSVGENPPLTLICPFEDCLVAVPWNSAL